MSEESDQIHPGMFRQPDVSKTDIVFVYAGDIWLVPKDGGTAHRLTSAAGEETFPRFNPDGDRIGFSASYGGNTDLYVISKAGGVPKRLTYHPSSDHMVDWHPDGEHLIFSSTREIHNGFHRQLYRVAADGGAVERLRVPDAGFGAYSAGPRPRFFAFQFLERDFEYWKRYRGGLAPEIYVQDLETKKVHRLTDSKANDAFPMWHDGDLYFVSDRKDKVKNPERNFEIFVVRDLESVLEQGAIPKPDCLTSGSGDVRFPAIGPSDLVFTRGSQVFKVKLDDGDPDFDRPEQIEIKVVADLPALIPMPRRVDDRIQSFDLSPDGSRLVVAARGDLFVLSTEDGTTDYLGRGCGSAERNPAWVDENRIIYHSDAESDEYDLSVYDFRTGTHDVIESFDDGFRYRIGISPGGGRAAFLDQANRLWIADLDCGGAAAVARIPGLNFFDVADQRLSWSLGAGSLAFHAPDANGHRVLWTHHQGAGEIHRLTSGYFDDFSPAFDPDGEYLYFVTLRGLRSVVDELDHVSRAYVDAQRLARVRIPSQGLCGDELLDQKVELLRFPAGRLGPLWPLPEGRLVVKYRSWVSGDAALMLTGPDLAEPLTLVESPGEVAVSGDGSTLVVQRENELLQIDLKAAATGTIDPRPVDTSGLSKPLDRRREWRQVFRESWRLVRDFHHDRAQLKRIRWDDQFVRYAEMLKHVATRSDLNHLINELYGEVSASHTRAFGGDVEEIDRVGVGLLGADLTFDPDTGYHSIDRILRVGHWEAEIAPPLVAASIPEKSCLLAVDGIPLTERQEAWAALQHKAGRTVVLKIRDACGCRSTERLVKVRTLDLSHERLLRRLSWVEENRRFVEDETGGDVGYVYIPNTSHRGESLSFGYHLLTRQLFAQSDKPGLIFDTRYNLGGPLPNIIIELIGRMATRMLRSRFTDLGVFPRPARTGAQVMLINAWTASAGELLAELFYRAGLGPLIGSRTDGGVNYWFFGPTLVDGGFVQISNVFHVDPATQRDLGIEGIGVKPGIDQAPELEAPTSGPERPKRDLQLRKAVEEVRRILSESDVS